ncbi:nucleoside triphosphate hydrolase [Erythrobacter phage vB_EliS_R6L]|nr:nucleoside triphosphate hydrolase [Erythrobacter phage vB_EliS_R6L]
MRIVQLHAENYKRLGVVEISPEGHLITVGGKNGHGKSSVLGAIYVALKGRAVAPPKPIRDGEEKCTIRLDLGDIVVTRNFHQKEGMEYTDTLKVESADGLRYSKPQDVLNALLGEIGFDPFEFVNLKPKEQVGRLLQMVPLAIDLDEFAEADASDMANRRDVNREVARLKAQVDAIPKEEVPADLPDRAALTDQLGNAANTNAAISREEQRREAERTRIAGGRDQVAEKRARAEALRAEAAELDTAAADLEGKVDAAEKALDDLPALDQFVDTDDIRQKLRDAEAAQAIADRQARRADLAAELAEAEKKSQAFTDAMAARAKQRNEALASAEMPVEGLSFAIDDDGAATLMWEGLPFDKDQISTAAQLRVSTAIGMAANPRLRVLRIMDGSLLDEDSMKMLAEMAEAEDFQLWVEVVGEGGVGIIMENGTIKGAPEAEAETGQDDAPAEKPKGKAKKAAPPKDGEKLL